MLTMIAALTLVAAQTGVPAGADVEAQNQQRMVTAFTAIQGGHPQEALEITTKVLASYDAQHASEKRRLYCGMSPTETLLYMAMAAKDKTDAIAVAPGYCTALYLKGYALVDLGRVAEARKTYEQVVALAPMHAHFITELGQLARVEKDWPRMLETCERASSAAELADPQVTTRERGLALRCQGYALVEEHKLDEAEKRYREALKVNPNDDKAQGELRYIAAQRTKG